MTVPPFPSQDLAKLVLGYLAEEQLMTAYDEFLQASPYLNALGNEYDRIFMTSLKNILAEYRAVKIYVETCKPFVLRKKLFQCPNLLEMVKFLIQHIDVTRIHESNQGKCGVEKPCVSINNCEVCKSLKQDICTCYRKHQNSLNVQSRLHETEQSENSVEATSLTDLPGNHVTCRRKNFRSIDTEVTDINVLNNISEKPQPPIKSSSIIESRLSQSQVLSKEGLVKCSDSLELNQKEEFNHILKQVCNKNQSNINNNSDTHNVDSQTLSMEGYNNFASGVSVGDNGNTNVPDSSTSEGIQVQIPLPNESKNVLNSDSTKFKQTRTQYLLKVANANQPNEIVSINTISTCTLPRFKPKVDDGKIKILSDVKVDNYSSNETLGGLKMPQVLKNATSTPLLQMQTIVINGTPVYKQNPLGQKHNYTKDEIMAMPTIILAPVSGKLNPSSIAVSSVCGTAETTTLSNSARQLGPLVIDVNSGINNTNKNSKTINETVSQNEAKDTAEAKIIDITSVSAPKDNTVTGLTETSTPQVMPPLRKSSSTPRRSSHIRVLDFTTPRRILHETINKCPLSTTSKDVEVVISRSPSVNYPIITESAQNDNADITADSSKENSAKTVTLKKLNNWDADLRALAIIHEKDIEMQLSSRTPRSKPVKKKKIPKKHNIANNKKDSEKISTKKSKSKKSKKISEPSPEVAELPKEKVDPPIKPTIHIITGTDRCVPENDKSQNKSNNENIDTPETERVSLQNDIGAKLNISDLLETPYKQVLYDIQMETPRFLGPDLPDDPLSAIKIMSIPTPRFLNEPTPSSYTSRPTDYSSGGSYYKPDDQDYMRVTEDLGCQVTNSITTENKVDLELPHSTDSNNKKERKKEMSSRPVRECTRNVSYYKNSSLKNKTKETENKSLDFSFSDTEGTSFCESPNLKEVKEKKLKHQVKSDKKMPAKIRKSPVKKEVSKSFMKIKPRRPTPVKKEVARKKRKTPETSKNQNCVKTVNKDTKVSAAPVVVSAPTKSRRKSSTPRKLHCTKTFNSESSGHDSPELISKASANIITKLNIQANPDSDTEHLALRWSDDGSQDTKVKELQSTSNNEIEDIDKIQDYIKKVTNKSNVKQGEASLHIDLVERGFDLETAKSIERDLLDDSPHLNQHTKMTNIIVTPFVENIGNNVVEAKIDDVISERNLESDCSTSNNLLIVQNDNEDGDEIELSVHECNEESSNYFKYTYDDTKDVSKKELAKLKDKFSMEVCLDDDLSIRLRATTFNLLFNQSNENDLHYQNQFETDMAVSSISNIEKLYTPLKKSIKAQCYDIFDSTLTSLDTPLKVNSPIRTEHEVTVTEIVLEVEEMEPREKVDTKKRKRAQSGHLSDECSNDSKRVKPEAQYLLNSANIQNIDIESVLSKLHGP